MRTFLALLPDPDLALAIDAWATRTYPVVPRRVAIQNLHMTMCFLGDINSQQHQSLERQLGSLVVEPMEFSLNSVGFFPVSGALWLGCESIPDGFSQLVGKCRRVANKAGIRVEKREAMPHFTLARRVGEPVSSPLEAPEFVFLANELSLLSSRLTPDGPVYETLMSC
ncbi:MAG: RNA 2',3'-cyclic phosphodiesterase [Granulosicoccus sp.]